MLNAWGVTAQNNVVGMGPAIGTSSLPAITTDVSDDALTTIATGGGRSSSSSSSASATGTSIKEMNDTELIAVQNLAGGYIDMRVKLGRDLLNVGLTIW